MANQIFLTGGAYIHVSDMKKEGYVTKDKNGKYKQHKYGFFDKLNDVIGYGKTFDINYHYLVFNLNRKEEKIDLYDGSSLGTELTELLKLIPDRLRNWSSDKVDYVVEGNKIRYTKKQENCLLFNSDGTMIRRTLVDVFGEDTHMDYTFYPFPKRSWEVDW
jgi:hypothetical protein